MYPFYGMIIPLAVLVIGGLVCFKVVDYLRLKATISDDGTGRPALTDLHERLDEIERRLTDVQDVMISLSEKFDRWEQKKSALSDEF